MFKTTLSLKTGKAHGSATDFIQSLCRREVLLSAP